MYIYIYNIYVYIYIYTYTYMYICIGIHRWKMTGTLPFLSWSKFIMFRRFCLELYLCSLSIGKKWFIIGWSWFASLLQSSNKAVSGVSTSRIKLFSKEVANCCQSYIHWKYATVSLLLCYKMIIMVYFSFERQITSYSKAKCYWELCIGRSVNTC